MLLPVALTVLLGLSFSLPAALVFAVLYGLSNGLLTIARGVMALGLFGKEGYGALLGRLAAPITLAKAVAPIGFAAMISGIGLVKSFVVCLVISLVSVGAVVALRALARRAGV